MKDKNTQNIDPYGINELSDTLEWLDENVSWLEIAKQIGIEKQIEIRAEMNRVINKINKTFK